MSFFFASFWLRRQVTEAGTAGKMMISHIMYNSLIQLLGCLFSQNDKMEKSNMSFLIIPIINLQTSGKNVSTALCRMDKCSRVQATCGQASVACA
jgi:hypothetical protein